VVAWGRNYLGETNVPSGLNGVIGLAAAYNHSVALRSNGTVVDWGDDSYGHSRPPAGLSNVVAIASGARHDLALRSDGSVVAWGDDSYGQTTTPGSVNRGGNIQELVDAAKDGDTILVAPGLYHLAGRFPFSDQITLTKAITLRSTMGPERTFLNLELDGWGVSITNSAAVLDGFTIHSQGAGGVYLSGGSVVNCNFSNFTGGDAVFMLGGILSNSVVAYGAHPYIAPAVYCGAGGLVTDCRIV